MADVIEGSTGAEEASTESSDSVALTAEQRDEQTIARLLGTEEKPGEETPAETADEPAAGDDTADPETAETADAEGETGAADEDPDEVTDEDIETILDALDDRLINHPRVQKVLDERAKADADRRYEERRRAESVGQESERLIRQGRDAVTKVHGLFTKLDGELKKAAKGEDVDESVTFDTNELMNELGAFGAAAVAEARRDSDTAFADAFREGVKLGGDLTDEEKEKVIATVQTAQRIANDPKQGSAQSLSHLFKENIKFLVDRAKAAGKAEAEAAFQKKRDAMQKVVGENGTKAAIAKLANNRKKLPGKPAAVPAEQVTSTANMEAYRAAKAAGDHEKADEIAASMQAR